MIPEGSARAIGHGTNLYASLDSFMEESYTDGRPKDYWSEVILFDGATQVARQVVRVNEPLVYRTGPLGWQEIRFHQSSFGNAVSLTVADENGKEIFNDAVALSFSDPDFGHRPAGYLDLRNQGVVLEVVGRMASITDPGLEAGDILVQVNRVMGDVIRPVDMAKLSMRQPKKVGNLTITFQRERPYSGLQVVYDPGNRIIWLACTLIILGIILVFYFPVRRLRAMCVADNGGFTVRITGISERGPGFDENFRRLVESLKAELGGRFEGGSVAPR
jgi:cytochrome c biogenesis protein